MIAHLRGFEPLTSAFGGQRSIPVASLLVENANGNLDHLIISPKSLTVFFEGIRSQRGSLDGLKIRVRKVSADRTAAYEVEELK